jgi:predicted Zn-dependent protease
MGWPPYSRALSVLVLTLAAMLLISACATVPVTGRRQLNLIPSDQILSMSDQEYDQFLADHELSDNTEEVALVKKVGWNIADAVQEYFQEQGNPEALKGYNWEFHVVKSDEVNAWCMPGGKVVFYTGILPICQNETGVAVVMGHEVSHAVAQHGNERMSQALLAQMGGMALQAALSSKPEQTRQLWMTAYGVGAQVGALLPYSRLQESEADHLGLIFMAMAGYDPHAAIDFWQRMAAQGGGGAPEFLSTHPSDQTRIDDMRNFLPEAMKYYRPAAH